MSRETTIRTLEDTPVEYDTISDEAWECIRKMLAGKSGKNPEEIRKPSRMTSHQILAQDPDTGMIVEHTVYPAGICPPKHRHSCGHGIFVLKGKLKTDHGIYGPGTMLWWPAGTEMVHGAADEEDADVLFITNGPFDLEFTDPDAAAMNGK